MKSTLTAIVVGLLLVHAGSARAVSFSNLPDLVLCAIPSSGSPWDAHTETETSAEDTTYYSCDAACSDQTLPTSCSQIVTARGRDQVEVFFVVDEDGSGQGMAGTLRYTEDGDLDEVVFVHKGGGGVEWPDDYLADQAEDLGHTAAMVKWENGAGSKGWFTRPTSSASLSADLEGITQRPAAVIKAVYEGVASSNTIGTVGCSGGSVATYYPRHWHGADTALRYQIVMGGPVLAHTDDACGGGNPSYVGRCSKSPEDECDTNSDCSGFSNKCVEYEWQDGLIMNAVRGMVDHLYSVDTSGATDCADQISNSAFDSSDFDNGSSFIDSSPGHDIDFIMDQATFGGDDDLNTLSHAALLYDWLPASSVTWTVNSGIHCDSMDSSSTWTKLKNGMGW